MATSIHSFTIELYREHLAEASFLYEQRQAYLKDPEVDWPSLQQWETRFEAHLDALVVGGDAALQTCAEELAGGDAGTLHTILRLYCRTGRKREVFDHVATLDPLDAAAVRAASQALCTDMPSAWRDDLADELDRSASLQELFAYVIGYRRVVGAEAMLLRHAGKDRAAGRAAGAWALGRIGTREAVTSLRTLAATDDDRVQEAALLALVRLGDDWALAQASDIAREKPWAHQLLAIGGHPGTAPFLRAQLQDAHVSPETIIAAGLLGDLSAVGPLLDLLGDKALAGPVGTALNTITGADLHARMFVPFEIDEDELDAEERKARKVGGADEDGEKTLHGVWERAPLQDKVGWRQWLEQNRHRFQGGAQRWRMGQPFGHMGLVQSLKAATTPHAIRAATYEQLVAQYHLDISFEADLPVTTQLRCLTRIDQWATAHAGAFAPGRWYFAGDLRD
jgi:uncharacterized protein (TIGR02270 family)